MWSSVICISSLVALVAAAPQDIANAAGVAGDVAGVDVAANAAEGAAPAVAADSAAVATPAAPAPALSGGAAGAVAAGRALDTVGAAQADLPAGRPAPAPIGQAYNGAAGNQPLVQEIARSAIVNADGTFNYSYDLSNGVHVEEAGYIKRDPAAAARLRDASVSELTEDTGEINVAEGAFSYTAPDGTLISLRYIADENGFQPQGDHLPTPHPAIQRALAAIAAGELDDGDDGSYRPSVHGQVRPAAELTGRSATGGSGSIAAAGPAVVASAAPALSISTAAPAAVAVSVSTAAPAPAVEAAAVAAPAAPAEPAPEGPATADAPAPAAA